MTERERQLRRFAELGAKEELNCAMVFGASWVAKLRNQGVSWNGVRVELRRLVHPTGTAERAVDATDLLEWLEKRAND